ncbi:hypothetical protein BC834DRAFT_848733 [Gloeopeniophorella convolvens]|nr:hypothetical protein BC834DRAFT_848733 [Gloeopeniophorella convolvens]
MVSQPSNTPASPVAGSAVATPVVSPQSAHTASPAAALILSQASSTPTLQSLVPSPPPLPIPSFGPWKSKLGRLPFLASFLINPPIFKPINYPVLNGQLVMPLSFGEYHRLYNFEMPYCFCGLITGVDTPTRFEIGALAGSFNYGRASIRCASYGCTYWVDLEELLKNHRNVLPQGAYDVREVPLPLPREDRAASMPVLSQGHITPSVSPARSSAKATPKTLVQSRAARRLGPRGTILRMTPHFPRIEEQHAIPAGSFSPLKAPAFTNTPQAPNGAGASLSATQQSDAWSLPPATQAPRALELATTSSRRPRKLEAALLPLDIEEAQRLVLKMVNSEHPGLSLRDFTRAFSECPGCHLMMATCILDDHSCSISKLRVESSVTPELPVTGPSKKPHKMIKLRPNEDCTLGKMRAAAEARREAKGKAIRASKGKGKGKGKAKASPQNTDANAEAEAQKDFIIISSDSKDY